MRIGLVWKRCRGYESGTKDPEVEVIRDHGCEWSKRRSMCNLNWKLPDCPALLYISTCPTTMASSRPFTMTRFRLRPATQGQNPLLKASSACILSAPWQIIMAAWWCFSLSICFQKGMTINRSHVLVSHLRNRRKPFSEPSALGNQAGIRRTL